MRWDVSTSSVLWGEDPRKYQEEVRQGQEGANNEWPLHQLPLWPLEHNPLGSLGAWVVPPKCEGAGVSVL